MLTASAFHLIGIWQENSYFHVKLYYLYVLPIFKDVVFAIFKFFFLNRSLMPLLMPFEPLRESPYWMLTLEPQPIGPSILLLVPLVSCFVYIFISYLFTLYHHFSLQFFFITDRIVEGALNAAKAAFPLIDMTKHKGEHPR